MPRSLIIALFWGTAIAASPQVLAADNEFPVLNSFGRYWGIGYTNGGYHAARDGRLDAVTNRHPASEYRQGEIGTWRTPYSVGSPVVSSWQPSHAIGAPNAFSNSSQSAKVDIPSTKESRTNDKPSPSTKPASPEEVKSPKATAPQPVGPPPTWLQDYLKDNREGGPLGPPSPKSKIEFKEIGPEASPSDLLLDRGVDSLIPAQGITYSIVESAAPAASPASPTSTAHPTINRYLLPSAPR